MILKTYTRILTTDLETTVATLKAVHGTNPHFMLDFDPWTLVGIGDVLAVGGMSYSPILGQISGCSKLLLAPADRFRLR